MPRKDVSQVPAAYVSIAQRKYSEGAFGRRQAFAQKCWPNAPARKIARSVHEAARDKARAIARTDAYAVSCRERKKVEMLFAHLKLILRLDRLRLRGPSGAKDEFLLAATAQNLRKLAKLTPLPAPIFAT
jgi:Transposase DDE domain